MLHLGSSWRAFTFSWLFFLWHRWLISFLLSFLSFIRCIWQSYHPYCYSYRRSNDCIMSALLLLLVTSLLASPSVHVLARDVDFCFVDEDDPYLYMGTKTAYHFVHGGKTRFQTVPSKYRKSNDIFLVLIHKNGHHKEFIATVWLIISNNRNDSAFITHVSERSDCNDEYFRPTDCRPVQIWMLAAHGTRCPTTHEIDKIVSLTNLKEQILQNHEERRGKSTFPSLFFYFSCFLRLT